MRKKMVLIGAGSAMFAKGLFLDIVERSKLKWHIALVDTDATALDIIRLICEKLIELKKADVKLSFSTERTDVLPDADYVVCTIGVGGRRAWEQDVFIPRKYGIYQPVGDSVGPGGVSRAMRMIPAMVDIANDVAKLCPTAIMFNYSNPMTAICMAVRRATKVPIVGLCHGVPNGWKRIAGFLGFKPNDGAYTACGLNHMVFFYKMRLNGEDLFPRLIDRINMTSEENRVIGPLTADFVRLHGSYIASDDRHYSEFVPEVMARDAYYGKTLGIGDKPFSGTFSFEQTISLGDEEFAEYIKYAKSGDSLPEAFVKREEGESEHLIEMVNAMEEDKAEVFYANMPNDSALKQVPYSTVIERPVLVSGSGIQPLQLPNFPSSLLPQTLRYAGIFDVVVQAALNGDISLMQCAIEESSARPGRENVQKLTNELLVAQKEYLPQFE